MAFVQSRSLVSPFFLSQSHSRRPLNITSYPKLTFKTLQSSLPVLTCSASQSTPATEQEIFDAVVDSDGRSLPVVRTYENNLARLSLVGSVDFEQALTAAAADGGEAAAEHIASGMRAMVVETVFPGPPDECSTVATRLFLPAKRVEERAKRLRSSFKDDFFSTTSSRNILSMTFRQVVLEQLWNFELVLFSPGTERNMEELQNPREVPASFSISSADERVISLLGEVVCLTALESTERNFLRNSLSQSSNYLTQWFHKRKSIATKDSSVGIYKLFEDEIIASARSLLENFNSQRAKYRPPQTNTKQSWWTLSTYSELEKIGGPDFSAWVTEYVPAYLLQIDSDILNNVKLEGGKLSAGNRWEVLLTHSQMVGLANVLDMYYEDSYTLPNKELSCGAITKSTSISMNKNLTLLLKLLSVTLASGCFIVMISVFSQLCLPYLRNKRQYPRDNQLIQSTEVDYLQYPSTEFDKLEGYCISTVKKIKDALGWAGDIVTEENVGAWIGEVPEFLKSLNENSLRIDGAGAEELKTSTQDIASYQVVLSAEGKIIGFQPTSGVAVNRWAANPLAKELYGGRKLSPGLVEPSLKMGRPSKLFVLELLMSESPGSSFALARPVKPNSLS